jgi:hypothetical protein
VDRRINVSVLNKELAIIQRTDSAQVRQTKIEEADKKNQAYIALVAKVSKRENIYAEILSGPRKGSIVRLEAKGLNLIRTSGPYTVSHKIVKDGMLFCQVSKFTGAETVIYPEISLSTSLWNQMFYFDGRKPVGAQSQDCDWDYLIDYNGPTVYKFFRPKKSQEEKDAEAAAKAKTYPVYDQLGNEIAIGDIFFYGSSNSLLIGKLTKVSASGVLNYRSVMDSTESRIMNQMLTQNVRQGKPCSNLLLYSKDLGDKIILAKLAKN